MSIAGNQLLALVASALLVIWLDRSWINIRRAMSVIKWFVFPIILLHVLFAGGERIWPESGIPLSLDGLRAGISLSLMLVTFFMVAMFVSRLWLQPEVLAMAASLPWAGHRMIPFLISMVAVRSAVRFQLEQFRQQFYLRRDWRHAGVLLTSMLQRILAVSVTCTHAVWLRWPASLQMSGRTTYWRNDLWVLSVAAALLAGGLI